MSGFQAIISRGTTCGEAGVDDGGPSLKPVVMVMMEEIGGSDGKCGAAGFDGGEGGMIVDDVVGQEHLVTAAAAEIQS